MKTWAWAAVIGIGALAACSSKQTTTAGTGGSASATTGSKASTGSKTSTTTTASGMPTSSTTGMTTMSTASGNCGGFTTGNQMCDDCITASCCAENLACDTGTDCDKITTCVGACAGDMACIMGCGTMFPNGVNDYNARATCIQTNCNTECSGGGMGICDSGLTTNDPTCDTCLAAMCCTEFDACTGGNNGMNMAMLMACLADCQKMPVGPLCAAADGCLSGKCATECGGG